jgi:hypothetical protein
MNYESLDQLWTLDLGLWGNALVSSSFLNSAARKTSSIFLWRRSRRVHNHIVFNPECSWKLAVGKSAQPQELSCSRLCAPGGATEFDQGDCNPAPNQMLLLHDPPAAIDQRP